MGTEILTLTDPARRAFSGDGPRPVRTHLWQADDPAAPLVLVSHGTGGAAQTLHVLIDGLHAAGFSVAAVDHHGNTFTEPYTAESFVRWWDRVLDLSLVLDVLEPTGPVGAAGFSIGGYTVAALLGARVGRGPFTDLVSGAAPAPPTPEFPGIVEHLQAEYDASQRAAWTEQATASYRDDRVDAAYLLCPMGAFVAPDSLLTITRPMAVRWGSADTSLPPESHALRYAARVPGVEAGELGVDAGHYAFIDGPDGGDPELQQTVATDAAEFFRRTLDR